MDRGSGLYTGQRREHQTNATDEKLRYKNDQDFPKPQLFKLVNFAQLSGVSSFCPTLFYQKRSFSLSPYLWTAFGTQFSFEVKQKDKEIGREKNKKNK